MKTFEARVVKGRLKLDEPSLYPEGSVVRLLVLDETVTEQMLTEEIGEDGLAALKKSLKRSDADFKAGRTHALEEVIRGRRRVR